MIDRQSADDLAAQARTHLNAQYGEDFPTAGTGCVTRQFGIHY